MSRHARSALLGLATLATGLAVVGTGAPSTAARAQGTVAFVQAVPASSVSISVDGEVVQDAVEGGDVVGPVSLPVGEHEVVFGEGADAVASSFEVVAGESSDLVLHRPAAVGGDPVVSSYPSPLDALGPDKARVILAHTATTAPADVRVDGETVFTNIANGEYAQADVASGAHQVALYPSGLDADPILGPLDVQLRPGTLTSVYAVGNPSAGAMGVVVRRSQVGAATTTAPTRIETGSAGLVGDLVVSPFSSIR